MTIVANIIFNGEGAIARLVNSIFEALHLVNIYDGKLCMMASYLVLYLSAVFSGSLRLSLELHFTIACKVLGRGREREKEKKCDKNSGPLSREDQLTRQHTVPTKFLPFTNAVAASLEMIAALD